MFVSYLDCKWLEILFSKTKLFSRPRKKRLKGVKLFDERLICLQVLVKDRESCNYCFVSLTSIQCCKQTTHLDFHITSKTILFTPTKYQHKKVRIFLNVNELMHNTNNSAIASMYT